MRILLCILLSVAAALFTACGGGGSALPAAQAQTLPKPICLGIGDSIMAGYIPGDGVSERLAQRESFMRDLDALCKVIESPVGGAPTSAALGNQVAWAKTPFDPALPPIEPAVVVTMLGTNDAVGQVPRGQALANVAAIIDAYPRAKHVIVSPPKWYGYPDLSAWMGPWDEDLNQLAVARGAKFVDVYAASLQHPEWGCAPLNGHPCEPAHRAMGAMVAAAVRAALEN